MNALSLLLIAQVPAPTPATRTDTVPPPAAVEQPFMVRRDSIELPGTLTLPKHATGRGPVAIIIAGSGPTDRNGNSTLGIRPNAYAQLAWRLAEQGIATLRYDKRGIGASRVPYDIRVTTIDDFARDARAIADSLARDPRFSRVVFLGHSEGSSLALLAARDGAPVAGVASVSGLGRPLGVVLREQISRQVDSATLVRYDTAMAIYLRGETPPDVPPALGMLFIPINQTFMRSLAAFDPAATIRAVRQPVLILQGRLDAQASVADAERLHAAKPDARLIIIDDANHVLKRATSASLAEQMPSYRDPTVPIMPEVVAALAEWIRTLP